MRLRRAGTRGAKGRCAKEQERTGAETPTCSLPIAPAPPFSVLAEKMALQFCQLKPCASIDLLEDSNSPSDVGGATPGCQEQAGGTEHRQGSKTKAVLVGSSHLLGWQLPLWGAGWSTGPPQGSAVAMGDRKSVV